MAAQDAPAIVHDGETRIEIGVVAKHRLHEIIMETIVLEQGIIGLEIDICAILILGIGGMVADKLSTLEDQLPDFSLPVRLHLKTGTKRIDRLDTHAIEADTLLESLAVILAARIEHAHSLHELALRNATAIIPDADTGIVDNIHLYAVTALHLELINAIVYDFLEKDVNAILRQRAITQTSDVHTWTGTHMLHVAQVANVLVGILYGFLGRLFRQNRVLV